MKNYYQFQVKEVKNSSEMNAFLDVPTLVYANDANWVPPLRSSVARELSEENNSFLEYGQIAKFIAVCQNSGKPLGRIVAAINQKLIEKENYPIGILGYFECIDNYEIAEALLNQGCNWLLQQGIKKVRAPINLSTHNGCLFLVEGFETQPLIMMPYNPPYYPQFILRHGWKVVKTAYAYDLDLNQSLPEQFTKGYQIASKAGITFRSMHLKGDLFERDCETIYQLMIQGFGNSWSYTPWTKEEFFTEAKSLATIADPDLVIMAEDKDKVVGFCLTLPDYNQALKYVGGRLNWLGILKLLWYRRQINQARVTTIFALPEYRRKMVPLALIYRLKYQGKKYKKAELSWVWEDNQPSRKVIEASGGKLSKTYQVYEKDLL